MTRHHDRADRASASPRPRNRSIAMALAALALAMIAAASPAIERASAVTDGVVGIRPATESDFFHLSLYPGAATEAVAIVSNQSSEPVTLLIYPVDGEGTPQGTFAFGEKDSEPETVGRWIDLGVDEVTIPAQSEIPVAFTVSVPPGTPPGDYAGGLIIQAPPVVGEVTDVGEGTALRLDVVQRQGLRVYLEVAGTALQKLDVGSLTWEQNEESIRFSLPIENTGNTILHPTGSLQLSGLIGITELLAFTAPESVLPGATYTMTAELPAPPLAQWGSALATIESEAGVTSASTDVVLIPWALVAILAVALSIAGFVVVRAIRFVRRARIALAKVTESVPSSAPEQVREPGAPPRRERARQRVSEGGRVRHRTGGRSLAPTSSASTRAPRHRR